MKINRKLIFDIIKTIVIGSVFAIFVNTKSYNELIRPNFSPPSIVFPIVWTILFILLGISIYLVSTSNGSMYDKQKSNIIYYIQLIVNALWTPIFFGLQWYLFAFIWIILLIILVIAMIIQFYKVSETAALIQIPYLLWLIFASVLNLSIYFLNR